MLCTLSRRSLLGCCSWRSGIPGAYRRWGERGAPNASFGGRVERTEMAGPPPPSRAGLKTCADFEKVWRPVEGRVYRVTLLFGLRAAAATDAVLWRLREIAFREACFALVRPQAALECRSSRLRGQPTLCRPLPLFHCWSDGTALKVKLLRSPLTVFFLVAQALSCRTRPLPSYFERSLYGGGFRVIVLSVS